MRDIFYSAFIFATDAFGFAPFEWSRLTILDVDPEFSASLLGFAASARVSVFRDLNRLERIILAQLRRWPGNAFR